MVGGGLEGLVLFDISVGTSSPVLSLIAREARSVTCTIGVVG